MDIVRCSKYHMSETCAGLMPQWWVLCHISSCSSQCWINLPSAQCQLFTSVTINHFSKFSLQLIYRLSIEGAYRTAPSVRLHDLSDFFFLTLYMSQCICLNKDGFNESPARSCNKNSFLFCIFALKYQMLGLMFHT